MRRGAPGLAAGRRRVSGRRDRRLRAIGRGRRRARPRRRLGGRRDLDRPEPAQLLDPLPGVTEHLAQDRARVLSDAIGRRAAGRHRPVVDVKGYGRDAHGAAPGVVDEGKRLALGQVRMRDDLRG